jgi:cytochrome P450
MPFVSPRGGRSFTRLYLEDRAAFLHELTHDGDLFRIRLLDKCPVVVAGPAQLHEALVERPTDTHRDPLMRHVIYPLLGEGLITSDGELWKRQRRIMSPIFTPAQLARYTGDIVTCARRHTDVWREGESLDVLRETTRITMAVAGKILFDVDMFSETDALGGALAEGLHWTGERLNSPLPLAQLALRRALLRVGKRLSGELATWAAKGAARLERPVFLPTAADRRMTEVVRALDQRVQRMIDARRADGSERRDLLGRLLAAHDDEAGGMSDKQLRDEIITLFVAGHETTATTLAWALDLLARHPEVYRRVRAQVDALDGTPRYEDLARLDLLVRVFKETMRVYPPIHSLVREAARDFTLGGYNIPAGETLVFSPYAAHHRAEHWPDPARFDPERFTPEAEASRPRYAFMAFSGGPRICLGMHLALMEGPLVLAAMLQRADFERVTEGPTRAEVREAVRPRGLRLRLRLRGGVTPPG